MLERGTHARQKGTAHLARELGFGSSVELHGASIPIYHDRGRRWYATADGQGRWFCWNDVELTLFGPHADAETAIRCTAIECRRDDLVDEASQESFPASDPPARTPIRGLGPAPVRSTRSSRC